jgi:hypothetical protein
LAFAVGFAVRPFGALWFGRMSGKGARRSACHPFRICGSQLRRGGSAYGSTNIDREAMNP